MIDFLACSNFQRLAVPTHNLKRSGSGCGSPRDSRRDGILRVKRTLPRLARNGRFHGDGEAAPVRSDALRFSPRLLCNHLYSPHEGRALVGEGNQTIGYQAIGLKGHQRGVGALGA
jgi:hypothetical protein